MTDPEVITWDQWVQRTYPLPLSRAWGDEEVSIFALQS